MDAEAEAEAETRRLSIATHERARAAWHMVSTLTRSALGIVNLKEKLSATQIQARQRGKSDRRVASERRQQIAAARASAIRGHLHRRLASARGGRGEGSRGGGRGEGSRGGGRGVMQGCR